MEMKTRKSLLFLLFLAGLTYSTVGAGNSFPVADISAKRVLLQVAPLTLAQILTGLQTQGKTPETRTLAARNRFIAERVRQRGVAFELSVERERDLRDAGADAELINIIRDKSETQLKPQREADAFKLNNEAYTLRVEKKDVDGAIRLLNKSIELLPNHPDAYNDRGLAYRDKGNYEQEIKDFSYAIELDDGYFMAYKNRGDSYFAKENYEPAIKDYNMVIKIKPDHKFAYLNRGVCYGRLNNDEQAMRDYTKALELDPNLFEANYNLGDIFLGKGDARQAIRYFNKAVEVKAGFARTYQLRAEAYELIGELTNAAADRRKYDELSKKP